jgi:hypothetical protein
LTGSLARSRSHIEPGSISRAALADKADMRQFAALMRGGDGDQFGDLGNAVPGKIGAADQTAHAVADQNDLLGAGGFADLVDSLHQLGTSLPILA